MRKRKLTFYFRETVHEPVDGRLIQIQYLVKMLMVSHHPGDVKDREEGRRKEVRKKGGNTQRGKEVSKKGGRKEEKERDRKEGGNTKRGNTEEVKVWKTFSSCRAEANTGLDI